PAAVPLSRGTVVSRESAETSHGSGQAVPLERGTAAGAKRPAGGRSQALSPKIEFTNLKKVFWPEDGYTKGDLIDYYDKVSPYLIPHLIDRPLVLERFPNGIHAESFYQKDAPDHTPEWIRTQQIWSGDVG